MSRDLNFLESLPPHLLRMKRNLAATNGSSNFNINISINVNSDIYLLSISLV